jgi:hypothetical protein
MKSKGEVFQHFQCFYIKPKEPQVLSERGENSPQESESFLGEKGVFKNLVLPMHPSKMVF